MSDYGWYGEVHYDYEPPEYDDYPMVEPEMYDPIAEEERRVILGSDIFDVLVRVYDDLTITVVHKPVEYTCWDGKFPF